MLIKTDHNGKKIKVNRTNNHSTITDKNMEKTKGKCTKYAGSCNVSLNVIQDERHSILCSIAISERSYLNDHENNIFSQHIYN